MKKVVFYQKNISIYVVCTVLFTAIAGPVLYLLIHFLIKEASSATTGEIVETAISCGCMILLAVYFSVNYGKHRVVFRDNEIYVPREWLIIPMQYKVVIPYNLIENITIRRGKMNSKGEHFRSCGVGHPYLTFKLKGQHKLERIDVFHFTDKQIEQIIDLAIERARNSGNNLEIGTGKEIRQKYYPLGKDKRKTNPSLNG